MDGIEINFDDEKSALEDLLKSPFLDFFYDNQPFGNAFIQNAEVSSSFGNVTPNQANCPSLDTTKEAQQAKVGDLKGCLGEIIPNLSMDEPRQHEKIPAMATDTNAIIENDDQQNNEYTTYSMDDLFDLADKVQTRRHPLPCFFYCPSSSPDTFSIQGHVYCDTYRVGFETNITEYISDAKAKVECMHFTTNKVEHYNEGVTDFIGSYKINVVDDHKDEICEVILVNSSLENCKEIEIGRDRAKVLLVNDGGISGKARHANSLGFLKNDPFPSYAKLLKEYYGLGEED